MNIKRRIKQLETAVNVGPAKVFCDCRENARLQVAVIDADGIMQSGERLPDECGKCRKPIENNSIIIQGVRPQIVAPI